MCVEIHITVKKIADDFYQEHSRKYYTTPTLYLELVNLCIFFFNQAFMSFLIFLVISMLRTKQQEATQAKTKLTHGLESLTNANKLVEDMKKQLSELQPQLADKVAITDQLLARISSDQSLFDGVKKVVVVEEAEVYPLDTQYV
jgi:dynein heavy chain